MDFSDISNNVPSLKFKVFVKDTNWARASPATRLHSSKGERLYFNSLAIWKPLLPICRSFGRVREWSVKRLQFNIRKQEGSQMQITMEKNCRE